MAPVETSDLLARIERLERRNRALTLFCFLVPVLALVGWQQATPGNLQVRRLEVVDERGVPLVVLAPDRGAAGGSVVLRDANGERRGWFTANPDGAALTLNREGKDGEGDSTLGLSVGPKNGRLSILSRGGASLSATMQGDQPKLELYNPKGAPLFVAPWTTPKRP
jgi:hypothetical protein